MSCWYWFDLVGQVKRLPKVGGKLDMGRQVLRMLLKYLLSGTCARTSVGCIRGDEGIETALESREFGTGSGDGRACEGNEGGLRSHRRSCIRGREVWRLLNTDTETETAGARRRRRGRDREPARSLS